MKKRLGEYLIEKGFITPMQLKTSLEEQKKFGEKLGEVLRKKGFISEGDLLESIAEMKNIKFVDMANLKPSKEALAILNGKYCKENLIYPLRIRDVNRKRVLYIATTDFYDLALLSQIRFTSNVDLVEPILATREAIKAAIKRDYYGEHVEIPVLNYEKVSTFSQADDYYEDSLIIKEEENLIIKSDEMYGRNGRKRAQKVETSSISNSRLEDLELEIKSLRKRLKLNVESFELEIAELKKIIDSKEDEMLLIEKRLVSVIKLLIKNKIFSKNDFFNIFKNF